MTWNPLTATLAVWMVTMWPSMWAHRQMRARTRSKLASAYFVLSSMSSLPFMIWSISLGGWWWVCVAIELLSLTLTTDAYFHNAEGRLPRWAAPR